MVIQIVKIYSMKLKQELLSASMIHFAGNMFWTKYCIGINQVGAETIQSHFIYQPDDGRKTNKIDQTHCLRKAFNLKRFLRRFYIILERSRSALRYRT